MSVGPGALSLAVCGQKKKNEINEKHGSRSLCVHGCLFHTKAKPLAFTKKWSQLLASADDRCCTAPHSELFAVSKQTSFWFSNVNSSSNFTPSVHFMAQKRKKISDSRCAFGLSFWLASLPRLQNGIKRMDFADDPSKQSWRGADNKGWPCRISLTHCVRFTVRPRPQSKSEVQQDDPSVRRRQNEDPSRAASADQLYLSFHGCTTTLLHWTYTSWQP